MKKQFEGLFEGLFKGINKGKQVCVIKSTVGP